MTLTQLRYVLSLARHGSFGKAAEHSLVAQPTLSIQIQKLEQELGVEIFDRKRSPIALTEPGKKVEAYTRRILLAPICRYAGTVDIVGTRFAVTGVRWAREWCWIA